MKALEPDEFEYILRKVAEGVYREPAVRDRVGLLLMHDAGLRVAEACAVQLADFSPDMRRLNVRGETAKWRQAGDDQVVAVSARLAAAVVDYASVTKRKADEPLLQTRSAKGVHPHHYNTLLARIGDRHLGKHIHPHMLRHSCGTVLACDAREPLPVVKEQMRHRNIATTSAYLAVRPTWVEDVAAAFG